MHGEQKLADVLEEYHRSEKTGVLYISVAMASECLIRLYFRGGEIVHLLFGQAAGNECLQILECYNLDSALFYENVHAKQSSPDIPSTKEIIDCVRRRNCRVRLIGAFRADPSAACLPL